MHQTYQCPDMQANTQSKVDKHHADSHFEFIHQHTD